MSPPVPRISEAEWTVMRVFWELGECSAGTVIDRLSGDTEWKPRTIQTLIRRLHQKGALSHRKSGRGFLYSPAVAEADCEHAASRSFLGSVFGGDLAPFLANFVERESLSSEEIDELKKILETPRSESAKPE